MARSISRLDSGGSQTTKAMLRLRQMILDGELAAGERIPELSLVERMGVSRTPIRAALSRLAEEGLLEPTGTGGFTVRAFDEAEVFDAIEVRGTLEGAAARRASERRLSRDELTEIRDCVSAIDGLLARGKPGVEEFSDYSRLNERYHALLVELARSPALSRAIERIVALPFAAPSAFVRAQADLPDAHRTLLSAQEQHRAILDAIAAGDGARAEQLARDHATLVRRNLRAVAQPELELRRGEGGNLIRPRRREASESGAAVPAPVSRALRAVLRPGRTTAARRPANRTSDTTIARSTGRRTGRRGTR